MRHSLSMLTVAAALAATVTFTSSADASVVLSAGQTLDVYFDFQSTPYNYIGTNNTLEFLLSDYSVFPANANATAKLYDGSTLLGSIASFPAGINQYFTFESATSAFDTGPTDRIDFSSIAAGTIQGLLQIQMVGDASANGLNIAVDAFGYALSGNSLADAVDLLGNADNPVITSQVVVSKTPVPEPASLSLLGAALLGFCFLYNRRSRA